MENKTLISVIAENITFELVEKVSKKGITYRACDIVFNNGERHSIGFAIDFYAINKKLKGGNNK